MGEAEARGKGHLLIHVRHGDEARVRRALQDGADPNERHPLGWTCLHVAAISGDASMCKLLLNAGADMDALDEYSPRHDLASFIARQNEFSDIVNPSADTQGFTPLHYAVLSGDESVVRELIARGADPNIEDSSGHVAVDYSNRQSITNTLRPYMKEHAEVKATQDAERKRKEEEESRRQRRSFPLEMRLKQHIVGQEGPIQSVAAAIRRRENGWHDEDHPLVFLFLGSSGVGKTELAKRVAEYMHKDKKGFIRLDMSEYQEKHEAAKLIGAPPGYVGHDEGGQLTKLLKDCPNAVVLLDEVEKAHPDVLTVMLQLFDEGRLTDGQGKTIDCKDAIFVMTSNLAADVIAEHAWELRKRAKDVSEGKDDSITGLSKAFKQDVIRPILKGHFKRDEFLGRIDEILYFVPFSQSELLQLAKMEMDKWASKATQRHKITLTWDEQVLAAIAEKYDIHYGARSLQHAVDQDIINRLAAAHEQDLLSPGCKVHIYVQNGDFKLRIEGAQPGQDSASAAKGIGSWIFGSKKEEQHQKPQ